jgi:predicted GH43/DUF377 family glycosyl hydrolase
MYIYSLIFSSSKLSLAKKYYKLKNKLTITITSDKKNVKIFINKITNKYMLIAKDVNYLVKTNYQSFKSI